MFNPSFLTIGDFMTVSSIDSGEHHRYRDSDDADVQTVKLDSMPRRLIGHCASFLDQKTYGILSLCNRAVYLGCNTPSKLTQVNVTYISHSDKLPLDLSRFPFATNLKIIGQYNRNVGDYFFWCIWWVHRWPNDYRLANRKDDSIAISRSHTNWLEHEISWNHRLSPGDNPAHQISLHRIRLFSLTFSKNCAFAQFLATNSGK